MLKRHSILLLVSLISFQLTHADEARGPDVVTILLKNKGKVKGVIIKETEQGIFVDVGFGTVGVSRDQIEEIEYPSGSEKGNMVRTWRRHRIETGTNIKQRKQDEKAVQRRI